MRRHHLALVFLAGFGPLLSGCTTAEETRAALSGRWIGQPSDAFFSQYGPPASQFPLNDGGTIYTWRGGDKTRQVAPTYRQMTDAERKVQGSAPQTVINIGTSVNQPYVPPGQVLVSPGRTEQLGCEAQITTNAGGIITNINTTRDTDGEGFSFSRCAEVFGIGS